MAVISAILAAVCVFGGLGGGIISFLAGPIALALVWRSKPSPAPERAKSISSQYVYWLLAVGVFVVFVVMLIPFDTPGEPLA